MPAGEFVRVILICGLGRGRPGLDQPVEPRPAIGEISPLRALGRHAGCRLVADRGTERERVGRLLSVAAEAVAGGRRAGSWPSPRLSSGRHGSRSASPRRWHGRGSFHARPPARSPARRPRDAAPIRPDPRAAPGRTPPRAGRGAARLGRARLARGRLRATPGGAGAAASAGGFMAQARVADGHEQDSMR